MESHGHSCINLPCYNSRSYCTSCLLPWTLGSSCERTGVMGEGRKHNQDCTKELHNLLHIRNTRPWPGQYVEHLAWVCKTPAFEWKNTHPSFRRTFSLKLLHSVSFKLWLQTHPSHNRKHLSSSFLTQAHHSPFAGTHSFCWQSSITRKSSVSKADLK